jgi:major membrane immunogen (membrane-anchored lipoprotein)
MKKIINAALMIAVSTLFTACTSSAPVLPDTPSFKQGKQDGCTTATGEYTKNSDAFNLDADYKNGWFYGRKNCNPVQSQS